LLAAAKNMPASLLSGKQPMTIIRAVSSSDTKLNDTADTVSRSYSLVGKYSSTVCQVEGFRSRVLERSMAYLVEVGGAKALLL
jgi:hypothetical protein